MPLQFFKLSLKKTQFLTNQTKRWTPVQSNKKRDSYPIKQKDGLLSNQTKRWTPVQSTKRWTPVQSDKKMDSCPINKHQKRIISVIFFNNFLKKF